MRRLLAFALLLVLSSPALAQFPKFDPNDGRNSPVILNAFRDVVAKPSESVVRVLADGKDVALGVVVDANGIILTKYDPIKDNSKVTCKLKDGKEVQAKPLGHHKEYDLIALHVDVKGLKPVEWKPSKLTKVGRWVASVGMGEEPVAIGVVSVATRPLVVGDQPIKTININSGFLGVNLAKADMGGAKVIMVQPKSPAEKAGFKVNDVIYEAAGKKILDEQMLIDTVGRLRAGDKILLKFKRDEEDKEITVTLGKRPPGALGGNPQELMGSELSNRRGGFPFILQHDTVLKPKDCGSPLVDLEGKAVGINIARAGRTETYAIPSEKVMEILPALKAGEILPRKAEELLRVASNLSVKDPVSKLGQGRYMKVHEIKLQKDVTYIIEMESSEIDSYLILEDAKGKKLAEDDDGGGFPNAKLTFTAPADGDYRILATTFMPNEMGNYTVIVRRQPGSESKEKK